MTDQQALEHIDQRMTEARDATASLVTHRAIIGQTRAAFDEAGVLSGPLPERVRKLSADLRDVASDRDRLRSEAAEIASVLTDAGIPTDHEGNALALLARVRMAVVKRGLTEISAALTAAGFEPGPDVTLAQRVGELARQRDRLRDDLNHVREMLDGAGIASDTIPAAVAMLLKERAEWRARMPAAPGVVAGGVEWRGCGLHVNGAYSGEYCEAREGGWWAHRGADTIGPLPNEPTARAVLLALAGQECGRVEFGLREDATVTQLRKLKASPLEWVYDDLLLDADNAGTTWTVGPEAVRAWVAHGQAALTIEAVSDAK